MMMLREFHVVPISCPMTRALDFDAAADAAPLLLSRLMSFARRARGQLANRPICSLLFDNLATLRSQTIFLCVRVANGDPYICEMGFQSERVLQSNPKRWWICSCKKSPFYVSQSQVWRCRFIPFIHSLGDKMEVLIQLGIPGWLSLWRGDRRRKPWPSKRWMGRPLTYKIWWFSALTMSSSSSSSLEAAAKKKKKPLFDLDSFYFS